MRIKPTVIVVVILLAILSHFIPVYSGMGYIVHPNVPGYINSDVCVGYLSPEYETYRVIPNGVNSFNQEHKYLKQDKQAAKGSRSEYGCSKPVSLKLYLW